ncbi:MAG TPA: PaaI family thioesterase [Thermoplasmata archaeon]|jgi:uncharacterized protein (TIGR00369 family)|nr:PaaI family thioesterase [Thermoplasmata archaeon]
MPDTDRPREHLVRWSDPAPILERARTATGLELLRELASGRLPEPPIAALLGMRPTVVEPGRVVFECAPAEFMVSPLGTVHGGIVTVLLDSAMACAAQTQLPAGTDSTTLELKVNFVRAVTLASGRLRAEGRVVHPGSTIATAEGRLLDANDQLCAHATSTLLVRRPRAP